MTIEESPNNSTSFPFLESEEARTNLKPFLEKLFYDINGRLRSRFAGSEVHYSDNGSLTIIQKWRHGEPETDRGSMILTVFFTYFSEYLQRRFPDVHFTKIKVDTLPEYGEEKVIAYMRETGLRLAGLFGGYGIFQKARFESSSRIWDVRKRMIAEHYGREAEIIRTELPKIGQVLGQNPRVKREAENIEEENKLQRKVRSFEWLAIPSGRSAIFALGAKKVHVSSISKGADLRIKENDYSLQVTINDDSVIDGKHFGLEGIVIRKDKDCELMIERTGDLPLLTNNAQTSGCRVQWKSDVTDEP